MKTLTVDIWSDIACPWCYVGKRRLEAALADFDHKDQVKITWHAFELDPKAPRLRTGSHAERIARKYGMSVADAQARSAALTETAAGDGLDFRFDIIQSGNTFDAHRVVHMATELGKGDQAKERLLKAYLTEGEPIGDPEMLVRLAPEMGLDADEVRAMLASDKYQADVRQDEEIAHASGITGVPFFVFGEKYAVSGAQPATLFRDVLEKTWQELPEAEAEYPDGAACGPDGCA